MIRKPGSPGREHEPGVILQGHLDMVCQQNSGTGHDFQQDPIRLKIPELVAKLHAMGCENINLLAHQTVLLDKFRSGVRAITNPGEGQDAPPDLGLRSSTDAGRTWATVSLEGQVDFHRIRADETVIQGLSAHDGKLLRSTDAGKTWTDLGTPPLFDFAPGRKFDSVRTSRRKRSSGTLWRRAAARVARGHARRIDGRDLHVPVERAGPHLQIARQR